VFSVDAEGASAAKETGADFIHKGALPDDLLATLAPLLRRDE